MSKSSVTSSLRQQLIQTFQDPKYRPPPLPAVAIELMDLSRREEVDVEDVVRVLERDEMLAGEVLRLVSSPIYAGRGPVRSLRDAVIRLGVRTVRNAVFEGALRRTVFNLPDYAETIERIGRHSTLTAYFTRIVCRQARIAEEQAFLAGLLHDIGFAALLFALAAKKTSERPALAEIWHDLDSIHEEASKIVTKLWGMPHDLSLLVGHHHHLHTGTTSHNAAVINIAEQLTERFSANIVGPADAQGMPMPADRVTSVELDDSRSVLSLDDAAMQRIVSEASVVAEQLNET